MSDVGSRTLCCVREEESSAARLKIRTFVMIVGFTNTMTV